MQLRSFSNTWTTKFTMMMMMIITMMMMMMMMTMMYSQRSLHSTTSLLCIAVFSQSIKFNERNLSQDMEDSNSHLSMSSAKNVTRKNLDYYSMVVRCQFIVLLE